MPILTKNPNLFFLWWRGNICFNELTKNPNLTELFFFFLGERGGGGGGRGGGG